MVDIITRAAKIIRNRIEYNSCPHPLFLNERTLDDDEAINQFKATYNILLELQQSKPNNDNNWYQLFCRRLDRILTNRLIVSRDLCVELYDDISYVLNKPSYRHNNWNWTCFLARMTFEAELEQRELQVKNSIGTLKELHELYLKHNDVLMAYVQKCISLHSKVEVRELIDNIDQKVTSLTPQTREYLRTKLKCIPINFDCSDKLLRCLVSPSSNCNQSNNTSDYISSKFLPSINPLQFVKDTKVQIQSITSALLSQRWFVILGDPGSAKTTTLRWITYVFSEAILHGKERVLFKGRDLGPARIPILIRIGEFAKWYNENSTSSMIDYIGKHTWFQELYIEEKYVGILKELIIHGHTLILFDGFDEITEVRQRRTIVDLVRTFIHEYVRAPNFISAFDTTQFEDNISLGIQSPERFGGNQVIITSRVVGYHVFPLNGKFLEHYLLLSMSKEESKRFVTEWIEQIESNINEILMKENIRLNTDLLPSIRKQYDTLTTLICNSTKSLISNPLILSVICMSMFNSPIEFLHKCRIQVYDYAVQSALRTWESQKSNISINTLINVLIDLATYLHLQSPSGLIDEFDLKDLCYCSLKQQNLSHNNTKLREYATELTRLLDHQISIISERGLQVFGFLHLSIQEYFVARSLVKISSIDKIAENCLSFTINLRFREPLLLALGWVSWKYSLNDYEKFCDILVNRNGNFVYPFGPLLLFDAFEDIQILPSNRILFTALNSLLDHPSKSVSIGYFIKNFSKLDVNDQIQWMQFHLINEKRIVHFCHCILCEIERKRTSTASIVSKLISPTITHHLWTLRHISNLTQHNIDFTLQRIMQFNISIDSIFANELFLQYPSLDNCKSDIHPLILSVIIAVCGGFRMIYDECNMRKLEFSLKYIYNKSSILEPINEYFRNMKDDHCVKIQILIDRYKNILRESMPTDTSTDIVDTFVALICLEGLMNLSIYEEFSTYPAFLLAIHRFEQIFLYLTRLYHTTFDYGTSQIETIIEIFSSHAATQHNEQLIQFSLSCASALRKLLTRYHPDLFNYAIYRRRNLDQYLDLQPEVYFYRKREYEKMPNQISINNHRLKMFEDTPLFLLSFVPQHLQNLYKLLTIQPIDQVESIPFVVFLSETLMFIESVERCVPLVYSVLSILQSLYKQHNLEVYASILFWKYIYLFQHHGDDLSILYDLYELKQEDVMDLLDSCCIDQDLRLFATVISLTQFFQSCYSSQIKEIFRNNTNINLSTRESRIICSTIEKINDPVLQMLALSTILVPKEPFVFTEEQRNDLRSNTFSLLKDLPECIPLLTATLLFVRCHPVRQFFPKHYPRILNSIIQQLNSESINQQSQEAAYIALRTLNNVDLFESLFMFERRTKNLSDLCNFNSTIFFRYFTETISFGISNINLLSSMYLVELSFDVNILKTLTYKNRKRKISPLTELHQLLHDFSISKKIMSFEAATWIEKNLLQANKNEITLIIEWISPYYVVERKALPVLNEWLQYRDDGCRKFFAHYAALHLVKYGQNSPCLIEIIQEIFHCKKQFTFEHLTKDLLELEVIDMIQSREIFLIIIQGAYRLSLITSATINCEAILDFILELEFQRIQSNIHKQTKDSIGSYLSIIDSCSTSVQLHLVEYLCKYIDDPSLCTNPAQSYYLASILHWTVSSFVYIDRNKPYPSEMFECIYRFLHHTTFPQVQKAIVIGFNRLFFVGNLPKEHVFMTSDVMIHLEQVIHSRTTIEYTRDDDDLLAICLLAYGNGLLRLQKVEIDYIVSMETSRLFETLSQRSSSTLISVRASLCYVFSQSLNATRSTIFSYFKNVDITSVNTYNRLLQETLYQFIDHDRHQEAKIISEYLKINSQDIIDKFVLELYNYLNKMNCINYVSEHAPNYLNIGIQFAYENFDLFIRALQRSTFGEINFKKSIYNAYQRTCTKTLIILYGNFSVITKDLIDMLAYLEDSWNEVIWNCLKNIKQISDRNAVEHLFNSLEASFHPDMLRLIIQLAQADVISLLEVHQRVSAILRQILNKNDETSLIFEQQILQDLMNLSCIRQDNLFESKIIEPYILTYTDIDSVEPFLYPDKLPSLFLRRNFFIDSVSFLMKSATEENSLDSTHLSNQ